MASLEKRIEELKDIGVRKEFVESLFKKLPSKSFFPKGSDIALEEMIIKFTMGKLDKCVVILEADYKIKPKPVLFRLPGGSVSSKYEAQIFFKLHRLAYFPEKRDDALEVNVNIHRGRITFNYVVDGEPKTKTYYHDDFYYYNSLSKNRFLSSKGIAIKEIIPSGIMRFGGRKHNFGRENGKTYAVVFFDKGKMHAFDLEGSVLLPALSSNEAAERIRLLKAHRIKEDMAKFDPKKYLENLMSVNRREWVGHPEHFTDVGRNYIIEGEMQRRTNPKGAADMILYNGEHKIFSLIAGAPYADRDVVLDFKGKNVLISFDGELINGHSFKSPLRYTALTGDVRGMKTLTVKTIRTISKRRAFRITAGPFNYSFSKIPLMEKYGSLDNFSHIGVIAYIDPANNDNNIFEMLLIKKDGSFLLENTYPLSTRCAFRKEITPSS